MGLEELNKLRRCTNQPISKSWSRGAAQGPSCSAGIDRKKLPDNPSSRRRRLQHVV